MRNLTPVKAYIYNKYGWRCDCCHLTDWRFFTLDHTDNSGAKHRAELIDKGMSLERWIVENNFPSTIRILCVNCNYGRQWFNGVCPHTLEAAPVVIPETLPAEPIRKPAKTKIHLAKEFKRKGYKECSLCKEYLPKIKFKTDKSTIDGVYPYCEKCHTIRMARYYERK